MNHPSQRQDLLQSLVDARDPETGVKLTEEGINSEAFAMLYVRRIPCTLTFDLLNPTAD